MKLKHIILVFSTAFLMLLVACSGSAEPVPQPTYTEYPTYTPVPLATSNLEATVETKVNTVAATATPEPTPSPIVKSKVTNSPPPTPTLTPSPTATSVPTATKVPVKAALMQSLPVDVSAVLSAGPIANSSRTFGGFGMPKFHDPNQRIPQWEFSVPLGTPALSPVSGTVSDIHILWSDDYTVMIRGDQGDWVWEVEHVINVEVRVGERVEAGQQVATASDFAERINGKGFGVVELGLLEGGRVPIHHCPLLYIDQTALSSITADLDAIRQENLQRLDGQGFVLDPVNDPYGQACWTHDPILDV